ncbi:MAG: shikimate kinase [Coriobacteriaceae bacterium]|nr:shikimate kinase [Coriobacteriaceae bacterium]
MTNDAQEALRGSKPSSVVQPQLARPVFFVGFMGAGKTSLARRLARMNHVASIDMDSYLERREGKSIADLFAEAGESAFRDKEEALLIEIVQMGPLLVSCGGGIVLRPGNRRLMKERGFVVYLKVSTEEAASRIGDAQTRPLFTDRQAAQALHEQRAAWYKEAAHVTIDTSGKAPAALAREVNDMLHQEGSLWQLPR